MKKNLVFKLGLFCAALVLIATCFVSSAWAKYTASVSASDEATVAKFAFDVQDDHATSLKSGTLDIFETTYFEHIKNDAGKNTLDDGTKLIAPGSYGTFKIVVSSTSQVALDVSIDATVTGAAVPFEWYVGEYTTGTVYTSLDAALDAAVLANGHLAATDGSASTDVTYTITWAWPYEGDHTSLGEAHGTVKATINVYVTQTMPEKK